MPPLALQQPELLSIFESSDASLPVQSSDQSTVDSFIPREPSFAGSSDSTISSSSQFGPFDTLGLSRPLSSISYPFCDCDSYAARCQLEFSASSDKAPGSVQAPVPSRQPAPQPPDTSATDGANPRNLKPYSLATSGGSTGSLFDGMPDRSDHLYQSGVSLAAVNSGCMPVDSNGTEGSCLRDRSVIIALVVSNLGTALFSYFIGACVRFVQNLMKERADQQRIKVQLNVWLSLSHLDAAIRITATHNLVRIPYELLHRMLLLAVCA